MKRPSLLLLTASAAGMAALANAAALADPQAAETAPPTRLGNEIRQDMRARDAAAARAQQAIQMRERAARAAETRLQAQMQARQQAQANANGANGANGPNGSGGPSPAEQQWDELARIYQAMRPKNAATVFEQLDMDVQMQQTNKTTKSKTKH